jgi:hypothetical protein
VTKPEPWPGPQGGHAILDHTTIPAPINHSMDELAHRVALRTLALALQAEVGGYVRRDGDGDQDKNGH